MSSAKLKILYPYGDAVCHGQIKQQPEDFKVIEQLGFEPSGEGEHLLLYVKKTGLTTHQMINEIAQQLSVPERHIGYSGLKDKHAVTQQWLSIQLPGCKETPRLTETPQIKIIASHWHDKKLRVGTHKSNKFEVIIRDITGPIDHVESVIEQIQTSGFANYFGEQRFGVQQDNVAQALRVLNNRHKSKRLSRTKKSLYLSSLRSELFNQVLNLRIKKGIWQQPVDGDVCMLAGSQSVFVETINDEIRQRYNEFDIHSGISLFGIGESRLTAEALEIENEVYSANEEITETLLQQKIKRSFRANRIRAKDLIVEYSQKQSEMLLQVELERGSYLTSLLNHFVSV